MLPVSSRTRESSDIPGNQLPDVRDNAAGFWTSVFHRSELWGGLFILVFALYALIYELLPDRSFFHATLQYEPEVRQKAQAALDELGESVSPSDRGDCAALAPVLLHIDNQSLQVLKYDFSFTATFLVRSGPGKTYEIQPRIHFPLDRRFDLPYRLPPGNSLGTIYRQLRIEGIDTSAWFQPAPISLVARCLFPTNYDEQLPENVVLLALPAALDNKIHETADYMNGFPRRNDMINVFSMIYLSASTITTAGFGDIVPLTERARGLVTSESIIGVVLAGLFLSAIGKRIAS